MFGAWVLFVLLVLVKNQCSSDSQHLPGIERRDHGCLDNTHFRNIAKPNTWRYQGTNHLKKSKATPVLLGTTVWINEYMAVGHMMYDVQLLEMLQKINVDRIVLQRARCATADLCRGIGTWDSFYKGYFMLALKSAMHFQATQNIPLHMRMKDEVELKPVYLSADMNSFSDHPTSGNASNSSGQTAIDKPIRLHLNEVCFEHLVRRNVSCDSCFHNSLSRTTVEAFKITAFDYINHVYCPSVNRTCKLIDSPTTDSYDPTLITYAYRDQTATRHMNNLGLMQIVLTATFPDPSSYTVQFVNTSNNTRGFAEQMYIAATSDVIVADHGAFESNIIYMRTGSLVVELVGNYSNKESGDYAHLAAMFGVKHERVVVSGLTAHRDPNGYNITRDEVREVKGYILGHLGRRR